MMAMSDETKPVLLERPTGKTGCMGSARIGEREVITIEQTNRLVLRWTTLTNDGMSLNDCLEVDVGEPPYTAIRTLALMRLAEMPLEAAISHPVRQGIVMQEGRSIEPFLQPIGCDELVDEIVEQARSRTEDAVFSILAGRHAIPKWTSQRGTWVELSREELAFVASVTGLPQLHVCDGDRVIVLLHRPVDGVVAIVLSGEVDFDLREGWRGIKKLVSSTADAEEELISLPARLLPADNVSLRIEPHRVRAELIDQLRIY